MAAGERREENDGDGRGAERNPRGGAEGVVMHGESFRGAGACLSMRDGELDCEPWPMATDNRPY
ncbi:hypothetical protein E2562_025173 [Oryza meyeriana var. granulata]|uniref:Uncharacterized protein n=1 Tax=Oryza meyeriana var. granulata TaxID=110450 RepID=A0A6G1E1M8_9ORYZ|nr:hypothetical protein E2562_025173 [Oryza meyeriana var. granulata]